MSVPDGVAPPSAPGPYRAERLVGYSDAVFSIALTLLAIEIRLPESVEGGLLGSLAAEWPRFLAFLISFLIITVVWFNHHEMFHHIRHVDHRTILWNTLLMLDIVLIPFASSLLGRAFLLDGTDARIACMLYGLWIAVGGLPFNLLWRHAAARPGLLREDADPDTIRALSAHYRLGPVLYLTAALASFVHVWIAVAAYVALILLYFLPGSSIGARHRRRAST